MSDVHPDPDKLHDLAKKWRAQADRLTSLGGTFIGAVNGIDWMGDANFAAVYTANTVQWKLNDVAGKINDFADQLDSTADQIAKKLEAEKIAAIVSGILGILALGLGFFLGPMMEALAAALVAALDVSIDLAGIATSIATFAIGFVFFGAMQLGIDLWSTVISDEIAGLPVTISPWEALNTLLAGAMGGLGSLAFKGGAAGLPKENPVPKTVNVNGDEFGGGSGADLPKTGDITTFTGDTTSFGGTNVPGFRATPTVDTPHTNPLGGTHAPVETPPVVNGVSSHPTPLPRTGDHLPSTVDGAKTVTVAPRTTPDGGRVIGNPPPATPTAAMGPRGGTGGGASSAFTHEPTPTSVSKTDSVSPLSRPNTPADASPVSNVSRSSSLPPANLERVNPPSASSSTPRTEVGGGGGGIRQNVGGGTPTSATPHDGTVVNQPPRAADPTPSSSVPRNSGSFGGQPPRSGDPTPSSSVPRDSGSTGNRPPRTADPTPTDTVTHEAAAGSHQPPRTADPTPTTDVPKQTGGGSPRPPRAGDPVVSHSTSVEAVGSGSPPPRTGDPVASHSTSAEAVGSGTPPPRTGNPTVTNTTTHDVVVGSQQPTRTTDGTTTSGVSTTQPPRTGDGANTTSGTSTQPPRTTDATVTNPTRTGDGTTTTSTTQPPRTGDGTTASAQPPQTRDLPGTTNPPVRDTETTTTGTHDGALDPHRTTPSGGDTTSGGGGTRDVGGGQPIPTRTSTVTTGRDTTPTTATDGTTTPVRTDTASTAPLRTDTTVSTSSRDLGTSTTTDPRTTISHSDAESTTGTRADMGATGPTRTDTGVTTTRTDVGGGAPTRTDTTTTDLNGVATRPDPHTTTTRADPVTTTTRPDTASTTTTASRSDGGSTTTTRTDPNTVTTGMKDPSTTTAARTDGGTTTTRPDTGSTTTTNRTDPGTTTIRTDSGTITRTDTGTTTAPRTDPTVIATRLDQGTRTTARTDNATVTATRTDGVSSTRTDTGIPATSRTNPATTTTRTDGGSATTTRTDGVPTTRTNAGASTTPHTDTATPTPRTDTGATATPRYPGITAPRDGDTTTQTASGGSTTTHDGHSSTGANGVEHPAPEGSPQRSDPASGHSDTGPQPVDQAPPPVDHTLAPMDHTLVTPAQDHSTPVTPDGHDTTLTAHGNLPLVVDAAVLPKYAGARATPVERSDAWTTARHDLDVTYTGKFDFARAEDGLVARGDSDFKTISDRYDLEALVDEKPMLSGEGYEAVKAGFAKDVKSLIDEHLGSAESGWTENPDRDGFENGYEDLRYNLSQRLEGRAIWEDLRGKAMDDASATFDEHPWVTARQQLFGRNDAEYLAGKLNDLKAQLDRAIGGAVDDISKVGPHEDLAGAVGAKVDELLDSAPKRIDDLLERDVIHGQGMSAVDGLDRGAEPNDLVWDEVNRSLKVSMGKDHDDLFPPEGEPSRDDWHPDSTDVYDEWNVRLNRNLDAADDTLRQVRVAHDDLVRLDPEFDEAVDAVPRLSSAHQAVARLDLAAAVRAADRADKGLEDPLTPEDISAYRQDLVAKVDGAFQDHLHEGDPERFADSWTEKLDSLTGKELGEDLDRLSYPDGLRRDMNSFDWYADTYLVDNASPLDEAAVNRMHADLEGDLREAYDNIFRTDRFAPGDRDAAWDDVHNKLFDSIPDRLDIEFEANITMRQQAGRFDAVDAADAAHAGEPLSTERLDPLADGYRTDSASAYHKIWNDYVRDVDRWTADEKATGDAFGNARTPRPDTDSAPEPEPTAPAAETPHEPAETPGDSAGTEAVQAQAPKVTVEAARPQEHPTGEGKAQIQEQIHLKAPEVRVEVPAATMKPPLGQRLDSDLAGRDDLDPEATQAFRNEAQWQYDLYGDTAQANGRYQNLLGNLDSFASVHSLGNNASTALHNAVAQRLDAWTEQHVATWEQDQLQAFADDAAEAVNREFTSRLSGFANSWASPFTDLTHTWIANAVTAKIDKIIQRYGNSPTTGPTVWGALPGIRQQLLDGMHVPPATTWDHTPEDPVRHADEQLQKQALLDTVRPDFDADFQRLVNPAPRNDALQRFDESGSQLQQTFVDRAARLFTKDMVFFGKPEADSFRFTQAKLRFQSDYQQLKNETLHQSRIDAIAEEKVAFAQPDLDAAQQRWQNQDPRLVQKLSDAFNANVRAITEATHGPAERRQWSQFEADQAYGKAYQTLVQRLDTDLGRLKNIVDAAERATAALDDVVHDWQQQHDTRLHGPSVQQLSQQLIDQAVEYVRDHKGRPLDDATLGSMVQRLQPKVELAAAYTLALSRLTHDVANAVQRGDQLPLSSVESLLSGVYADADTAYERLSKTVGAEAPALLQRALGAIGASLPSRVSFEEQAVDLVNTAELAGAALAQRIIDISARELPADAAARIAAMARSAAQKTVDTVRQNARGFGFAPEQTSELLAAGLEGVVASIPTRIETEHQLLDGLDAAANAYADLLDAYGVRAESMAASFARDWLAGLAAGTGTDLDEWLTHERQTADRMHHHAQMTELPGEPEPVMQSVQVAVAQSDPVAVTGPLPLHRPVAPDAQRSYDAIVNSVDTAVRGELEVAKAIVAQARLGVSARNRLDLVRTVTALTDAQPEHTAAFHQVAMAILDCG